MSLVRVLIRVDSDHEMHTEPDHVCMESRIVRTALLDYHDRHKESPEYRSISVIDIEMVTMHEVQEQDTKHESGKSNG